MANGQKGEIGLTLGGTTYRFKLGTHALIELQELFSTPQRMAPIEEIFGEVSKGRLKYVRGFLWAGLRKFHSEMTQADVEDVLDEASEPEVNALLAALGLTTQPDPKDLKELRAGAKRNPRKAQSRSTRGTGGNSTSKPAASV